MGSVLFDLSIVTESKMWLIAGCSTSMTPPVALMSIGGNPERAPAVMKHNADALLNDRDRLIRWQKWYEKPLNRGALFYANNQLMPSKNTFPPDDPIAPPPTA